MIETYETDFANDVLTGLTSSPKYLSSKYLYDCAGTEIFQDIMKNPEYYLTGCEYEIFSHQKDMIHEAFFPNGSDTDIIELGSGDGLKTRILLEHFLEKNTEFTYIPVDISEPAITCLVKKLKNDFPSLDIKERIGDYFTVIHDLKLHDSRRKIILFLGSNIGNYTREQCIGFLKKLRHEMEMDDSLFIGFDLIKDPNVIFAAYNDAKGDTSDFNLNLLKRINRELDGDFGLENFRHYESYNPVSGTAKSYLLSSRKQDISIGKLNTVIHFEEWEPVHVEMSQKYSWDMIRDIASESGFKIITDFIDSRSFFTDSVWRPA